MDKQEAKKLLKIAAFIYVMSFLVINWNDISWIFNYKEVSGIISDFFNPYPSVDATSMDPYFYPNHSQTTSATPAKQEVKTNYTDKQNTLEIPKISISVPIIFSTSANKDIIMKDLDLGVVFYPGSVYPGAKGQMVILGHSAPAGWPKVKHDWVFTNLDSLNIGDKIYIDLNNKQYTYKVQQKNIIKRGAEVPVYAPGASNNVLTLISCWPPGKDYQRIAVTADLQSQ